MNPERIPAPSPGLRGTSYPGRRGRRSTTATGLWLDGAKVTQPHWGWNRFRIAVQPQFPALRRFRWKVELQGLWRNVFRHKGMNFDAAVRDQANPAARQVARINDAEFISGRGIEAGVMQFEWLVIK